MGIKFFKKAIRFLNGLRISVQDEAMWWLRKDVSWRFKFLNLLSGDRLRHALAFHGIDVKDALCNATEAYNNSDGNPDYYGCYAECARYYAEQAAKSLEDIWKI